LLSADQCDFFHCQGGSWVDRKKMKNMMDFDFSKPFGTVPHDILYLCIWFFPSQSAVVGAFPCWISFYRFQATYPISHDLLQFLQILLSFSLWRLWMTQLIIKRLFVIPPILLMAIFMINWPRTYHHRMPLGISLYDSEVLIATL